MGPRIFRYVVRYDGGSAPRPYGGVCTLAICKPRIRATAMVGDWTVGFRSGRWNEVIYVMQVAELLPLGTYWQDPRFYKRRPDGGSPIPDNIYRPRGNQDLEWVPNEVHDRHAQQTDTSGRNTLVGEVFWYFGDTSPLIAQDLRHLVPYPRGYTVNKYRRSDDIEKLISWLSAWPQGIHGVPVDASAALKTWLRTGETSMPDEPAPPAARCGHC